VARNPVRPHRQERNLGILVGGAFALLGIIRYWRHPQSLGAMIAIGVGIVLIALGVAFPAALIRVNRLWMMMAEALGVVMTQLILFIVFFVVITPTGAIRRLIGADPLRRRAAPSGSYWEPYPERNRQHYEKMF